MDYKKVGILGGTFNPFHNGHLNVAKFAYQNLGLDEVWLIPTYQTPNKRNSKGVSPKQRFNIIKKCIKNEEGIKVKPYEINRKETSYTSDTIDMLRSKYPETEFYLIMGDDSFNSINTWKNYKYIISNAKIVVFKRKSKIDDNLARAINPILVSNPIWDVSSTIVRKGYFSEVPEDAKKYISSRYLYLEEIVENDLSVKRWDHTLSVAKWSRDIARYNKISRKKSYYAGIAHDIAKEWTDKELIDFVRKYEGSEVNKINKNVLHAFAGYYWWLNVYGSNDKKIASAILNHTTGAEKMDKLSKTVYVADKIASNRNFSDIELVRRSAKYNINIAFKKLITIQFNHLKNEIGVKSIDENTLKAYRKYK